MHHLLAFFQVCSKSPQPVRIVVSPSQKPIAGIAQDAPDAVLTSKSSRAARMIMVHAELFKRTADLTALRRCVPTPVGSGLTGVGSRIIVRARSFKVNLMRSAAFFASAATLLVCSVLAVTPDAVFAAFPVIAHQGYPELSCLHNPGARLIGSYVLYS